MPRVLLFLSIYAYMYICMSVYVGMVFLCLVYAETERVNDVIKTP